MTTYSKQQTETASLCRVSSITPEHVSRKLRVAGWLLLYDRNTSIMLLTEGESAVLVDLALCLDPFRPTPWLRESNSILMVIGSLEEVEDPYPPPVLPMHARPVEVDLQLVLRALSIRNTPQLDLELWNKAIRLREQGVAEKNS
ncbi:uncharacterized protein B0H18DRAFT_1010468 [Fomitopsis serialis]|uniref:uncharacterized protein n=1 Tax=Fomitopsis serialis TaxID=139415 RepID=UPI002007EE09|nr:uncharacterized protein B0H18DRAFT_1010468 [Neoantrodia serialis]KAH9924853.1 hypothetical protein B0H18DRAFT_1010468 [Neoantrodia serialis]